MQSGTVILNLLFIVSSINTLDADETNYACLRYNLRDPVAIRSLDFSRDGKQLAVSAQSAGPTDLRVIDLLLPQADVEGTKIRELGDRTMGECARLSPDGQFVAAGAWSPSIDIWDIARAKLVHSFRTEFRAVTALAFDPNGVLLTAGGQRDPKVHSGKNELILFDFKKRHRLATVTLVGEATHLTHLIFTPDGRRIYVADSLDTISVVDVEKRQVVKKWRALDDDAKNPGVLSLSLSRDGKLLASGGRDNKVKIWDAESGKLLKSFDGHQDDVLCVALSPDGKYVATCCLDGWLWVREVETGRSVETISFETNCPCAVAFSPDGQWLASGGKDGTIHLDRVADFQFLTPKPKAELKPVPSTK